MQRRSWPKLPTCSVTSCPSPAPRSSGSLEGRRAPGTTLPVVVVLDGEGGERVIACDDARADDGREILVPLDGVDSSLLPGVFDSFVADALALARLARDGQAATDERWERLLADARDALGR
jgi:hypothetical protein